jgi:F1F0 ATPase subunit 2
MTNLIVRQIAPYAGLGALLAAGYLSALDWNVRLYAAAGAQWRPLLLHLARLLVVAAAFTMCARQGARQLVSCFVAFLVVRVAVVRRYTLAIGKAP